MAINTDRLIENPSTDKEPHLKTADGKSFREQWLKNIHKMKMKGVKNARKTDELSKEFDKLIHDSADDNFDNERKEFWF
ncbi:hypothetical protein BGAL_0567g00040 [Botrytis galanthina]|uniref:Uncharacterized protein n=1 Tax=Botrytis galanthina TaxID=278940 RepID=A0A4S8QNX6_9HELO|nr:hypothetical protein BGAL_0567g00040 [Botrytis galanthina]